MNHKSLLALAALAACLTISAQNPVKRTLNLNPDRLGIEISPTLAGIFFEDINQSVDGGICAQLIQNNSFQAYNVPDGPENEFSTCDTVFFGWTVLRGEGAKGIARAVADKPLVPDLKRCYDYDPGDKYDDELRYAQYSVRFDIEKPGAGFGIAANGYGIAEYKKGPGLIYSDNTQVASIPAAQGVSYDLALYLQGADYKGNITIYLEDADGRQKLDFTFHVIPAGQVARVGREYYTDLQGAFDAAGSGQEVELLSDCTLNNIIKIPGGTSSMGTAKSLRLDLNGHYIIGNDTSAYLIAGDAALALTIRDTAENPKASNVPIKVAAGSYLTIESGKFDVLPAYSGDDSDAAKHIYITGGWYQDNPSRFVVAAVATVGSETDGYYPVERNTHPVIVVIGDQVTSYENATDAFAYLNEQDTKTDATVKAIMSFNGPAALSGNVITLGEGLDLTMVYNYSYRNASCIKGEGSVKLTVDGATITSGDTAASPYALVLDGVDLEVNSGAITAKAINYARLGCVTAICLDGGGSSTMYYNGQVVNKPTTNGRIKERGVSDIVYIAMSASQSSAV